MEQAIRVLVIDDEELFAQNIARLLNARGFHAETAFSGMEAMQAMARKQFNVAVLDVKMPGMTGIETLQELKKKDKNLEVLMLTGFADVESGSQAIRDGAFDFLFKPCDVDVLAEKIREAITAGEIKRRPVLWPRSLVKEISSAHFIRLSTEDDLQKAVKIFDTINYPGMREELHVTDAHNRLCGIVTRKDLIVAAEKNQQPDMQWKDISDHPEWLPQKHISEIMHRPPDIFSAPDEKLSHVAARMVKHNLRCLPVIDEGRLVGIIRLKDVLQYYEFTGADALSEDAQ